MWFLGIMDCFLVLVLWVGVCVLESRFRVGEFGGEWWWVKERRSVLGNGGYSRVKCGVFLGLGIL